MLPFVSMSNCLQYSGSVFSEVGALGCSASIFFKRFFPKSANSPSGYFFKYSLKSSGFALSFIESQKIISAAVALSLTDFAVREFLGVLFFGGGVVVFGVGVFFGDGNVAFGSCAGVARLATRCAEMKSSAIAQTINAAVRWIRKEWLFLFIGYPSKNLARN